MISYKFLTEVVTQGSKLLTESFRSAYRLIIAGGGPKTITPSVSHKMRPDEALKILNIERSSLSRETVIERYEKLYLQNDPDKGGSFYLRSKIYRAKESLDREVAKM
jgi:mitochondrial import inner membrane translocase subunit TIM16